MTKPKTDDSWYGGTWIRTHTGQKFYSLKPTPGNIHIEDIAHALSNQCRFGGHIQQFYSVAQHSVFVAERLMGMGADNSTVMAGLLHDASEAYLVDVPRPLKPQLKGYTKYEDALCKVIAQKFEVPYPWPDCVKEVDARALFTEARDLLDGHAGWWENTGLEPYELSCLPGLIPTTAKIRFMNLFVKLRVGSAATEEPEA